MKFRILLISGVLLALSSCKKEEAKATYLEEEKASATLNTVEAAKNNAAGMLLPPNQNPVNVSPQNQITPGQPPASTQPTAPGMNPPHGQPGHRCEIAVGAPLNSAPKTTAPAPQQIVVDPANAKKDPAAYDIPQNVKTAPGMNPPHGQPGHRCDISVGAPLNSPAKSTTSTPSPVKENTTVATVLPDPAAYENTLSKPTMANAGGAGMNPAHGAPGHRCDIAVGAPLK